MHFMNLSLTNKNNPMYTTTRTKTFTCEANVAVYCERLSFKEGEQTECRMLDIGKETFPPIRNCFCVKLQPMMERVILC